MPFAPIMNPCYLIKNESDFPELLKKEGWFTNITCNNVENTTWQMILGQENHFPFFWILIPLPIDYR